MKLFLLFLRKEWTESFKNSFVQKKKKKWGRFLPWMVKLCTFPKNSVCFQKMCKFPKIVYTFKNCEHFQSWWRMICLVIRNFRIWSYDKKVCCIPTWFLWRYSSGGKLMLSRKLASRRKRDDQSTIGQLPASRSITWHSARARILQPARRRWFIIIITGFPSRLGKSVTPSRLKPYFHPFYYLENEWIYTLYSWPEWHS